MAEWIPACAGMTALLPASPLDRKDQTHYMERTLATNKASPEKGDNEVEKAEEQNREQEQASDSGAEPAPEAQIAELQDKLLRLHAEMDNLRKRSAREIADARKFAIERFATSLLDVVDNLERALEVEEGNEQALRDGVKLTLDSWHTLMERFEIERFDAVGEEFDAHRHEALSQVPSDQPKDTVVAQHVAGYTLHGRLLRPAKVLVSAGNG